MEGLKEAENILGRKIKYPQETCLVEIFGYNKKYYPIKDENGNLRYELYK